jgi:TRAP-type C4-dicarboxylate transport system permease large subunit
MFMLLYRDMMWNHVEKDTLKKLRNSSRIRKLVFDNLTIGVNVVGTDVYQNIATWLLTVPENKLRKITIEDVMKAVGNYIDETGNLV